MRVEFEALVAYPTLPLTVLLAFFMGYWVITSLTGGSDFNEPDVEPTPNGLMAGILYRLGFNAVPFLTVLTLLVLFMWAFTYFIHINFLVGVSDMTRWIVGSIVIVLSAVAALLPVAVVIIPIKWAIRKLGVSSNEDREVRGREGLVVSTSVDGEGGRVRVNSSAQGAVMILEAKSLKGQVYKYDTPVVVIDFNPKTKVCSVMSKEEFEVLSS